MIVLFCYSLTSFLKTSVFGTGSLLLDDIYCSMVKDHIDNCGYVSTYRTYCNHSHDLSLICTRKHVFVVLPHVFKNSSYLFFKYTTITAKNIGVGVLFVNMMNIELKALFMICYLKKYF